MAEKELRRGPTIRCEIPECMGNPKKKDLIQAQTFEGTICKKCFCVHEWMKENKEQEINTDEILTQKEQEKKTEKLISEAKKRVKKKTVKQTGLDFQE